LSEPTILVKSDEAARLLEICERTLMEQTRAGVIPVVRIGTLVRFSPAALQAWAIEQSEASVSRRTRKPATRTPAPITAGLDIASRVAEERAKVTRSSRKAAR
jgi:excisionase family DNA binding protein